MRTDVVSRQVYPLDITELEKELSFLVERLGTSKAEIIREAIKHYAEYISGIEVVENRNIAKGEAKEEIKKYIKGKKYVSADEISRSLRIDMSTVNEALIDLWQDDKWVEPI